MPAKKRPLKKPAKVNAAKPRALADRAKDEDDAPKKGPTPPKYVDSLPKNERDVLNAAREVRDAHPDVVYTGVRHDASGSARYVIELTEKKAREVIIDLAKEAKVEVELTARGRR